MSGKHENQKFSPLPPDNVEKLIQKVVEREQEGLPGRYTFALLSGSTLGASLLLTHQLYLDENLITVGKETTAYGDINDED